MLDGFRISSAVSNITNQKYFALTNSNSKCFARQVTEKIMANYRNDATKLQGLPIRRQAIRLATDVLIELEYEYEAKSASEDGDADPVDILTTIEWLRECLLDFGRVCGEQMFVADCLAHHENVLQALIGQSATIPAETAMQTAASMGK